MSELPNGAAPASSGNFVNTGVGPMIQLIDIGHPTYVAIVEPDLAFWSLIGRDDLADTVDVDSALLSAFKVKAEKFKQEMTGLRFGLKPSAVYFNPTERCNLNCTYCYIPQAMRRSGRHMAKGEIIDALERLQRYFAATMEAGARPQIIFHGAEPLLNKEALFCGIDRFHDVFRFGLQTNGTLLDQETVDFLTGLGVSIGLSLDGGEGRVTDRTRRNWHGEGIHSRVLEAMERLRGYNGWSVISTITRENQHELIPLVELFHRQEVPTCLLNIVRCTLPGARTVKPDDDEAARCLLSALDRVHELYKSSGRKLVVANFANILLSIIAPTARRLMCDISPCGGGRCFFALAPGGDLYPCSEFIGLPTFKGGNLFEDDIAAVLESEPFKKVTSRRVEDIEPCRRCAIRHFCGAPCPAEAHELHGEMNQIGAFCGFYEEQVRYAFRLIADQVHEDFLWDGWDDGATSTFELTELPRQEAI